MNLAGIVLIISSFLVRSSFCQSESSVVISGNEEDGQVLDFKNRGENLDTELAKLNVDNKNEITAE